ncbi:alanyl-tRNA editing protein [Butyrivibrio sp. MC2021]|uniref:alanyl-tRNA editing protein n=1 Tax=Butyrivibrio sp. MC2021 TaxID=1408306 RepID=UPI0005660CF5|nr:alanyl-tRNA editing protein [Butyrivibrio sp. MC2021]
MGKTEELYYTSAYISEFDAQVLSCHETKDGKYAVVLDRTAFFPEQGGQSSDTGTLTDEGGKEYKVTHVSIGDEMEHMVSEPIAPGSKVFGVIDWAHRFSNMQQHTGEHIFSGVVNSDFGYNNVGFHLSDNEVTMDYDGVLTKEDIARIEDKVNAAIWENIEVIAEFPDSSKLAEIDYRSKKELEGDVRIVTIPGYDVCACCAPHVARTGEIGFLKVVSLQNYKGGVRVSILCGKRALEYLRNEHEILGSLSGMLTTSADKVLSSVEKAFEENKSLKAELTGAREELMEYELSSIDKDKKDVILIKNQDVDGNLMRKTVNALTARHSGVCGFFAKAGENSCKYIIASGADKKDLKKLQELMKEKFAAKGGGSSAMIQGSISGALVDADAVYDLISTL